MSRYHIEEHLLDNTVFPEEIYIIYYPYLDFPIQKGNSSGLWLYGIIDCIYSNTKYKNIDDVLLVIDHNDTVFVIDIINFLSNKLYNISDIIDNFSIETNLNTKENRIYELIKLGTYSFRKEAALSNYFSLASLFGYYGCGENNYNENLYGIKLLLEYQFLIDNIQNFLNLVNFNNNYFKLYSSKEIYEMKQKYEYENLIKMLNAFLNKVHINYEKEFYNILYNQIEKYLNYGRLNYKIKIKNAYNKLNSNMSKIDRINTINIGKLKKDFENIKNYDRKVVIR